ncbi:MAG: hypothetical protein ACK559_19485, partial [bacterium]
MRKWHSCNQGRFGCGKSLGGGGGPIECFWIAAQQVRERPESRCNFRQKSLVKIYHTEELLKLLDCAWSWEFLDCCHM